MILEIMDQDELAFQEIMEVVQRHACFEKISYFDHPQVITLGDLEIIPIKTAMSLS